MTDGINVQTGCTPAEANGQHMTGGGIIDLLRFVFSGLLVYYHVLPHLAAQRPDEPLFPVLIQGTAGCGGTLVIAFYILSGMFFARSMGIASDRQPPRGYLKNRVLRLWPVMAFSLLVNWHGMADFANLFFIHRGIGVLTAASSNQAAWYVCDLFWLTAIFWFWYKDAPKKPQNNALLLLLVLFSFAFLARKTAGGSYYLSVSEAWPFVTVGMLLAVGGFSCGILFAQLGGQKRLPSRMLVSTLQLVLAGWFIYKAAFSQGKYALAVYTLLFLLLLYFTVYQPGLFLQGRNRITKFLGAASYDIYMMQAPMLRVLDSAHARGWLVDMPPKALLVGGVGLFIAAGIATHLLIERPVNKLLAGV